jgi:hypothetical protein
MDPTLISIPLFLRKPTYYEYYKKYNDSVTGLEFSAVTDHRIARHFS